MEPLKRYIIDFYETHDHSVVMNFYDTMKALSIKHENELNELLQILLEQGFIECYQEADNVIYLFRLAQ